MIATTGFVAKDEEGKGGGVGDSGCAGLPTQFKMRSKIRQHTHPHKHNVVTPIVMDVTQVWTFSLQLIFCLFDFISSIEV